jgi:hypothetical protein
MRKLTAMTLGILVATLALAGIGQAQGATAVRGTIQSVDCRTNAVVLNAPDGTHVFPAGPNTAVFVNSAPVGFCTLQQYIGSSATVSVVPYANQWVAERVDVYVAATPAPTYPAPTYSTAPPWLGIVLGTIVVGGLVYLLVRGHDGAVHRYPYSRQYDQYRRGDPYYGPNQYDQYRRGDPYYGPNQYDQYRRGDPYYGPYQYDPYQRGNRYGPNYGPYYGPYGPYDPYQRCIDESHTPWCPGTAPGDRNR